MSISTAADSSANAKEARSRSFPCTEQLAGGGSTP
jgi:hypothetical protein